MAEDFAAPTPATEHDGVSCCINKFERRRDQAGEFIAYGLQTCAAPGNGAQMPSGNVAMWRRFNEFVLLSKFLQFAHPDLVVPPLPEKKINFKFSKMTIDKFDPDFVQRRRDALNVFLDRLMSHPVLRTNTALHAFLTRPEWNAALQVTIDGDTHYWSPSLVDDKVKSASALMRNTATDRSLQEARNYADALQVNLTTLLNTHGRLAKKTHDINIESDSFRLAIRDLSEIEPDVGGLLEDIADIFDGMAPAARRLLAQEDRMYAEPLKEYVFFTDSIRSVVRKHEQTRAEREKAETTLRQKEEALAIARDPSSSQGIRGLWASITTTSEADREAKQIQAAEQVDAAQVALTAAEARDREFVETSTADIQRFHQIKVQDMKRLFATYARSQESFARQSLDSWKQIRSHCQAAGYIPLRRESTFKSASNPASP